MSLTMPVDDAAPEARLRELIESYFELLHTCDISKFDDVFDPHACLYGAQDGSLVVRPAAEYKQILASRTSPKMAGAIRDDEILQFDLMPTGIAYAKVKLISSGQRFVNYLTFFHFPAGWRIVSKTYSRPSH